MTEGLVENLRSYMHRAFVEGWLFRGGRHRRRCRLRRCSIGGRDSGMKDLPEIITEFDESLWAGLVDSMTVHGKDRIVFRLTCGMEIEV